MSRFDLSSKHPKAWEETVRDAENGLTVDDANCIFAHARQPHTHTDWHEAEAMVRLVALVPEDFPETEASARRLLTQYLGHESPSTRKAAVEALWGIPGSENEIRIALLDSNEWVRRAARCALGLGDDKSGKAARAAGEGT